MKGNFNVGYRQNEIMMNQRKRLEQGDVLAKKLFTIPYHHKHIKSSSRASNNKKEDLNEIDNLSDKNKDENKNLKNVKSDENISFNLDLRQGEINQSFINKSINSLKEPPILKKEKIPLGDHSKFIFKPKIREYDNPKCPEIKEDEFLFLKYNYNCILKCIVSLISITSVILEYEVSFKNQSLNGYNLTSVVVKNSNYLNNLNLLCLWVCFISTILLWGLIIIEYLITCKILQLNQKIPENKWRKDSEIFTKFILTLIIFSIHPNPIFKDIKIGIFNDKFQTVTYYSLNSIFGLISLLRLWFFLKLFLVNSEFYSPRLHRICEMNNFAKSLSFSMKSNMVYKPYYAYLILFMSVLIFCSFGLRIFERELDMYSNKRFYSYWNVIWCIIITMTTVGYGDYFPSTFFGRIIGIVSCVCGVILISMLVVTVTNVLNFEGCEKTVFDLLERISLMEEKEVIAARYVSKYFRMMQTLKYKKINKYKNKENMRDDVLYERYKFKNICKEISNTYPPYSSLDVVLDELEYLEKSLDSLKRKYDNSNKSE